MSDLYRKVTYEADRFEGDGDEPNTDMVTYRTKFVPVVPCEHGNYARHIVEQDWKTIDYFGFEWCPGAALEGNE